MTNSCVKYGKIFDITFNPLMSNCVAFHPSKNSFCPRKNVNLNNRSLDWLIKFVTYALKLRRIPTIFLM